MKPIISSAASVMRPHRKMTMQVTSTTATPRVSCSILREY
jgi:hypothetical protein